MPPFVPPLFFLTIDKKDEFLAICNQSTIFISPVRFRATDPNQKSSTPKITFSLEKRAHCSLPHN